MPRHRHRIRDIVAVSGLSEATVDRVLHGRGSVSADSADAVRAAMAELDRQQVRTDEGHRKLSFEVIAEEDPVRVPALRTALHELRPQLRPHVVHTFVRTVAAGAPDAAAKALALARNRRPQGILLDVDDDPSVAEQVESLSRAGIPVVTTRRPLPDAALGHSGLDDRVAGRTAGYLIGRSIVDDGLVVVLEPTTSGEQDRADGCVEALRLHRPDLDVVSLGGTELGARGGQVGAAYLPQEGESSVAAIPEIRDRLSTGGALVAHSSPQVLDLLRAHVVTFVIDVDWLSVVREGTAAALRSHRRNPTRVRVRPTPPVVLTPYNLPY